MKRLFSMFIIAAMLFSLFAISASADPGDTEEVIDIELPSGDVNGDGMTDPTDAILIKSHLLNALTLTGDYYLNADTDGNGVIDITDYILVKLELLGIAADGNE